jgi:hypothetical protein
MIGILLALPRSARGALRKEDDEKIAEEQGPVKVRYGLISILAMHLPGKHRH